MFFERSLNDLKQKHPHIGIRGRGFLRGISFENDKTATEVSAEAFKLGLIVETSGVRGHMLKLLPALTVSHQQLQDGINIISDAIHRIRGE
ncbi:aminotransferase class III-fold pyridoxal phosphate-dependent enzyme [Sodalis praecaptivus]|uniref:aminotransferase class III-fold pyridoxal phosphate-dependent enzyme n=1 Tax=Sodalis praecaptivus TaxID=1239307 RepID=UPI00280B1027|nr:aminotransferase class III-fold pyridoxal phosphate-dependent enzyme [Sodalis praecaptivus]